jgi:hypothetical protein
LRGRPEPSPTTGTRKKHLQLQVLFSAIFAYGELNLLCKLNWLTPAKLPAGSWGEYNLALCAAQNLAVSKKQFSDEVI